MRTRRIQKVVLILIIVLALAVAPASASPAALVSAKASLSSYSAWIVPGGADIAWSIPSQAGVTSYQIYRHRTAKTPGLLIATITPTGPQGQAYAYHDATTRPLFYSIRVIQQGGPTRYGPFPAV